MGAQNAINLLQTAEPLLNIRINPTKTRHFSLHWSPPTKNSDPHFSLDTPSTILFAHASNGEQIPIPPIPLSTPTRVLGAFIAPDLSTDHVSSLLSQIKRIKNTLNKKRASLATLWTVLKSSIYPKFTYLLKFTNLSMSDLSRLAAPFRDLIRRKANASHLPNTILFGGSCSPYSLQYFDLMHHTLKEKESTMLRMLGGSPRSRQIIHSLLSRGYRLITDHCTFNTSPLPCPTLPHYSKPPLPSQYCWALALIQYLQAADSNTHITPPFPRTYSLPQLTQTPIHSLYSPSRDSPLTLNEVHEFESSYHIYFVEELFSYPPQSARTTIAFLTPLFPTKFINFLTHIINIALNSLELTLGTIITREHTILKLPNLRYPAYIEGLVAPANSLHPSQALVRCWKPITKGRQHIPKFLRLPHIDHLAPLISPIPTNIHTTTRYLRSAIGYTPDYSTCRIAAIQQRILPRISTGLSTTYAQPVLKCNFDPMVTATCLAIARQSDHPINIYTDGSLRHPPSPNSLLPTYTNSEVYASVIFSTSPTTSNSWSQRDVIALRIRFPPTTTANNYTAEILGVATATSLPIPKTNIYTDAKGIVTSVIKTLNQHFTSTAYTTPHLPRNYTETGLLYKHIILSQSKTTLHHIKAHQEDSYNAQTTEHGTGNRIADLVAQGDIDIALSLCNSLHVYSHNVDEFIQSPPSSPLISIGQTPSTHDFSFHHPNVTSKAFHVNAINHWLTHVRPHSPTLSTLKWEGLTWNLAGAVITKYSTNHITKLFLFKALYNALPNEYTKYKYATRTQRDLQSPPITPLDLPLCPLCSNELDSLSHVLCTCTHPTIIELRKKVTHHLHKIVASTHPNNPTFFTTQYIITAILSNFTSSTPDHRNLLGLFYPPYLSIPLPQHKVITAIFLPIVRITAPYIHDVWKTYNTITHPPTSISQPHSHQSIHSQPSTTTNRPHRLLIISGNNGTLSLQSVIDHPPGKYQPSRGKKRTRTDSTQKSTQQPLITSHFALLTSHAHHIPSRNLSPQNSFSHSTTTTSSPFPDAPAPLTTIPSNPSPTTPPQQFIHPSKTYRPPQLSLHTPNSRTESINSSPYTNSFGPLEVFEPTSPSPDSHLPHQITTAIISPTSRNIKDIFDNLSLIPHDVPQTVDCFFLAIQLFIAQHYDPPILTPVHTLRNSISLLLTTTSTGASILKDYNLTHQVLHDTLPDLRPSDYPNRDIYAQDYAIAAMSTLLNTTINIFTTQHLDSSPILHTFDPYPDYNEPPILPHAPPPISLWATQDHFQLLLLNNLSLPSLTTDLLPLPPKPLQNTNNSGQRITIQAPSTLHSHPTCTFHNPPLLNTMKAFCTTTCHPYCSNHYSAFRTIPHQRTPPNYASSQLLATAGASMNTPIFEIASTIHSTPSPLTFPITSIHHSDAPKNHPLLQLMYSSHEPNCHLVPILIPEPSPHLKLFVVTSKNILPYTSLRIRPPPEPPPPSGSSAVHSGTKSPTSQRSLITSYFQRPQR